MVLLTSTILVVLLLNVLYIFREKRFRRLASAQLEIVKTVTEMETMMLQRRICTGNIFHDHLHERMVASQYAKVFSIDWGVMTRDDKSDALKERIVQEIKLNPSLGEIIHRHALATYKAFINQRPIMSLLFWVWVVVCAPFGSGQLR